MTKTRKPHRCKTCGEYFTPTGNNQRYCIQCGREQRNAKQRDYVNTYAMRYYGGYKP